MDNDTGTPIDNPELRRYIISSIQIGRQLTRLENFQRNVVHELLHYGTAETNQSKRRIIADVETEAQKIFNSLDLLRLCLITVTGINIPDIVNMNIDVDSTTVVAYPFQSVIPRFVRYDTVGAAITNGDRRTRLDVTLTAVATANMMLCQVIAECRVLLNNLGSA